MPYERLTAEQLAQSVAQSILAKDPTADVGDDTIKDIRFQTFGCGSAVATSSMITELVVGMSLDDALKVSRGDVADALDEIGTLLELKGENAFRTNAYHNAARLVQQLQGDLHQLVAEGKLGEVRGIGDALSQTPRGFMAIRIGSEA